MKVDTMHPFSFLLCFCSVCCSDKGGEEGGRRSKRAKNKEVLFFICAGVAFGCLSSLHSPFYCVCARFSVVIS